MRGAKYATGVLIASLALTLSACKSSSYTCSGSKCSVTLSGDGSRVKIKKRVMTLEGVTDGKATVKYLGAEITCAEGDSQEVSGVTVTCTKVTEEEVKLSLTR